VRSAGELRGARLLPQLLLPLHSLPHSAASSSSTLAPDRAAALRHRCWSVFARVLADCREARAPCAGRDSPAWALLVAQSPLAVPLDDLELQDAPTSTIFAVHGADGGSARHASVATSHSPVGDRRNITADGMVAVASRLVGRLVALVDGDSGECMALAYVQGLDRGLRVVSLRCAAPVVSAAPVMGAIAHATRIVGWDGANDVPSLALYRSAPETDDFATAPALVATVGAAAGAAMRSGATRVNLARRGGGGGATPWRKG